MEARGGRVVVAPTSVRAHEAPDLRRAVQQLSPDVIQVLLIDPTSMMTALEACSAVAPTIATLHMRGEVPAEQGERVRAAYAGLHHLVAVSAEVARLALTTLGVPGQRLTHVVNGVDPVDPVRTRDARVPVVGALGRPTAQKGFDVLVDALRMLVERGVHAELVVGGEGRERTALEQRAEGLPVRFLGFCDGPRRVLEQCDVFCLPSRAEGLPLVLVEALSAGLPAVATDAGDVRRVLEGVVDIVPPEDAPALASALELLLLDPVLRRAMAVRGAEVARRDLTAQGMAQSAWSAFLAGLSPRR